MIRQRGIEPSDRPLLAALLASVATFSDDERAVAIELVDHHFAHPTSDDYRFILSVSSPGSDGAGHGEEIAGYLCYGRTPMTRSTYDLYWMVTSPSHASSGVARELVARLESELAGRGGGLVRVETASREGHGGGVHFYDALGFARAATIADFYAPGDDLIVFTKRVWHRPAEGAFEVDEPALYDAALGYRDYAAERDFLLACARRFGERPVHRVLGWSAGPGRHLQAFADAGVAGTGTDPSASMVAYARRIAGSRAGGPELRFVQAALDARPEVDPPVAPVDLSFVLLASIHLLTAPGAMERHLHAAADLLCPGGVHVIEATHPADLTPSGVHHTEWTEAHGDTTVDARLRMHIDRITEGRLVPVTLEVVHTTGPRGGGKGSPRFKQEDQWLVPDLPGWRAVVASEPRFALAATLGDFNVDVPFEHGAAWRLFLVLERQG